MRKTGTTSLGFTCLVVLSTCFGTLTQAQEKKTRDQQVLEDLQKMKGNEDWIYDDFEQARLQAESDGKPMMIVLRCIP